MRKEFIKTLVELAQKDSRIFLLTGDLGFTVIEEFQHNFPNRFFNVGVAEQNMIGIATGLAESGFIPFTYSITTFSVLRPYEFIRNGPIKHRFPVRIIGIGEGFEYGPAGTTHHSLEDVGVMRIQHGICTIIPADDQQARSALLATWNFKGPIYYRLSKNEKAGVPGLQGQFQLGKLQCIQQGSDVLMVTMGGITSEVIIASEILKANCLSPCIVILSSFNPSPMSEMREFLSRFKLAITIEAHYMSGGLGSFVCEQVAEGKIDCQVIRLGIKHIEDRPLGSQNYLNRKNGLNGKNIAGTILKFVSCLKK